MKGIYEAFTAAQAGGASDIEQIRQKVRGWIGDGAMMNVKKDGYLVPRGLSGIWSVSISFNHEFHEWTNDTNLFRFSIREIRLFVSFVIPKLPMPHGHDSSTRGWKIAKEGLNAG